MKRFWMTCVLVVGCSYLAVLATPPLRPEEALPPWPASMPTMKKEIADAWEAWRQTLKANDLDKLDLAAARLYQIAQANRGNELRPLVAAQAAEYDALAKAVPLDFHARTRLDYLAMTTALACCGPREMPQSPPREGKSESDEKAAEAFQADYRAKRRILNQAAEWYVRLLEDAAGKIDDVKLRDAAMLYAFEAMQAGSFFLLPLAEDPEATAARLAKVKPQLEAWAKDGPNAAQHADRLRMLYEMTEFMQHKADSRKQIEKLIPQFITAFNARNQEAFENLFVEGMGRKRFDDIGGTGGTIVRMEVVEIEITLDNDAFKRGTYPRGSARVRLLAQYRDGDGKTGELAPTTTGARWTEKGWRLE